MHFLVSAQIKPNYLLYLNTDAEQVLFSWASQKGSIGTTKTSKSTASKYIKTHKVAVRLFRTHGRVKVKEFCPIYYFVSDNMQFDVTYACLDIMLIISLADSRVPKRMRI